MFAQAGTYHGEMPGKSPKECGNYINLDTELGREACQWYAQLIAHWTEAQLAY